MKRRGHRRGAGVLVYGKAWPVYAAVIAGGGEAQFGRNAVTDIKFGPRTPDAVGHIGHTPPCR